MKSAFIALAAVIGLTFATPNLALAHGTGGSLGHRHGSATVILERE